MINGTWEGNIQKASHIVSLIDQIVKSLPPLNIPEPPQLCQLAGDLLSCSGFDLD